MDRQTNSLLRFGVLGCVIAGSIIGFFALVSAVVPVLPILLGVTVGIGGLVLFCWGFTRIAGHLMYGDDPLYQEWCRTSDPWFDTLPAPFRAPEDNSYVAPQVVCDCGATVVEPITGAFRTTGVLCPVCNALLRLP